MKGQKILLFDFDGVIHSYESGWKGPREIPDPPVNGALKFLTEMVFINEYEICIYSARSRYRGGISAIKKWLEDWLHFEIEKIDQNNSKDWEGMWQWKIINNYQSMEPWHIHVSESVDKFVKMIGFPKKKPGAYLTIDDRAICFDGDFSTLLDKIDKFKPWNKI